LGGNLDWLDLDWLDWLLFILWPLCEVVFIFFGIWLFIEKTDNLLIFMLFNVFSFYGKRFV
jgi:hypothetical protein